MWVNMKDASPQRGGFYLCQDVFGDVSPLNYTVGGGWNTLVKADGSIDERYKLQDTMIARWYEVEVPEPVPDEWEDAPQYDSWADFGRDEISYDNLSGTYER